ncbi:MAG: pyridoxal 4-dehydrogenase [Gemmatimonadetes bacterium]|mgnify:FL=1|nr:pyridoxal 4-dehydrogenase [Gemmatimonadota bacterium]|tara:strand:- start:673 stop:1686 length:1014 start_codon:yes stop_codon:yes gene_type:complete
MLPTSEIGNTGVQVTQLGFGAAPLGELFNRVTGRQATDTLEAAWEAGIRYYDTAPFYGHGKSEHRVGHFLQDQPRDEFALSTKVGRVLTPAKGDDFTSQYWNHPLPFDFYYDYSYDGVMRSFEQSLHRLGVHRVDLLMIHDLDIWFNETETRVRAWLNQLFTSGWRALEELKSSGAIRGIGAGINELGMIPRFAEYVNLDCCIVAMPYTLLDQETLDTEFPLCEENGVGVIVGAPFSSGILATGAVEGAYYKYDVASPEILDKTSKIEAICERHGVPLIAAALQFPLLHPVVNAIIPGALVPEHARSNAEHVVRDIPSDMWAELKQEGLIRQDAPTP